MCINLKGKKNKILVFSLLLAFVCVAHDLALSPYWKHEPMQQSAKLSPHFTSKEPGVSTRFPKRTVTISYNSHIPFSF